MTEADAWQEIKPRLGVMGMATRIENSAGASVPDVIFMSDGLFVWIELKINHGGAFIMPRYQYAYMVAASKYIRNYQHWFAVRCDDGGFKMMTAERVKLMQTDGTGERVKVWWEPTWDRMPSQFVIYNTETCELWVDCIQRIHRTFR